MSIFNMWREARGAVMQQELQDLVERFDRANQAAQKSALHNVLHTIDSVGDIYEKATASDRRVILTQLKKSAHEMWRQGDWPSALGLGFVSLHVESWFVPGSAAAYVKAETAKVIQQARSLKS